jgi:hypothetical protein
MDTSSIGSVANLLSFSQVTGSPVPATRGSAHGHHCHGGAPQCSQTADDSAATLSYRRTERAGLYIVTQEGDVVRLRIKVRDAMDATASSSTDSSTDSGTEVAQLAVDARSSVKISFHVDGDLNADELAAIRNVVEQVGALADQFFGGDVPAAFAAAKDLNIDGAQLAKVGLRLSVRQSVTYSGPALAVAAKPAPAPEQTPALPVSTPPSSSAGNDTPSPVAAEPVASAPDASTSTADVPAVTDDAPTPPSTDAAPTTATPAATSVAGSALATIADFLHQLLGALGAPATSADGASQLSVSLSLKLRIFAATVAHLTIVAPPAADGTEQKAAPLVGDTLDALAAAHDPPLNASA